MCDARSSGGGAVSPSASAPAGSSSVRRRSVAATRATVHSRISSTAASAIGVSWKFVRSPTSTRLAPGRYSSR